MRCGRADNHDPHLVRLPVGDRECSGLPVAPEPEVLSGNDVPPGEFLTANEKEAIRVAGNLAALFGAIIGPDHTRDDDMREVVHHVHAIQNAVLAQVAARVYPDTYRLMGRSFFDAEGNRK